jgi:cytochrome P450
MFVVLFLLPGSWLPGWSKYIAACEQLDTVINDILVETRNHQQQQQQQEPGTDPASTGSSTSSSSRQTLMSFLLAAQQTQGRDAISDEQIGYEIKTVMFAGTDTSAFTLAMCAYYLAQNPAAAERAAAEVRGVLQQTGRTCVSQLRADDTSKLPWVMACLNETMRLAPAAPVITRTAVQVRLPPLPHHCFWCH